MVFLSTLNDRPHLSVQENPRARTEQERNDRPPEMKVVVSFLSPIELRKQHLCSIFSNGVHSLTPARKIV